MQAKALPALVLLLASFATSGCYLSHVAAGQWRLLRARQPIPRIVADPATPAAVREPLARVADVRRFARELGLSVGEQYTSYVAWPGDRVVTAVVATRPGEVTPAGFWFPLIGTVPYKGYFDRERAEAEAARLRDEDFDVCSVGVRAYSTLGWLADPVTEPMLRSGEGWMIETILHELVHATFYVSDEARFNEGVATFVGQEGSLRFHAQRGSPEGVARERVRIGEERVIRSELLAVREAVEALYAATQPGEERDARRLALVEEARLRFAALSLTTRDAGQLAAAVRLNDACLALAGTYAGDLDAYAAVLASLGGDLQGFLARAREASRADAPREALLGP